MGSEGQILLAVFGTDVEGALIHVLLIWVGAAARIGTLKKKPDWFAIH